MQDNNFNPSGDFPEQKQIRTEHQIIPAIPPITAAFFGLIGIFLLYQVVGSLITLMIFGMDFENADINALRLLTMGGQILLILFPALLLTRLVYHDVTSVIRVKIPNFKEIGIFVLGLIIITPLLQSYLYLQNYLIEKIANISPFLEQVKNFVDELDKFVESTYAKLLFSESVFEASFIVLVVAVVPAVCEEIFFRGYVQKSFEFRIKPFTSALLTAVFFGLYHFNPYGLIALIGLGLYFGFAAYTSNSIFIPIILHFLNNFIAVIIYFIFGNSELLESKLTPIEDINANLVSFVVLLILFGALIYYIKQNYYKISSVRKEWGNDLS